MFFYNLDQIVCVGACVGEARNKPGDLSFMLYQTGNRFLASQIASNLSMKVI